MQLIIPAIDYKKSFIEAVKEYQATDADDRLDIFALNVEQLENDFEGYITQLLSESKGENLPKGYVPQTTYWLIDGLAFIGRVSIRHELSEHLLLIGGHIGYDIRPSQRNHGFGTQILRLSLPKAKALGITKVLVTCNENNIGSKKIIETNGGVLENAVDMGEGKPRKLRYWINI